MVFSRSLQVVKLTDGFFVFLSELRGHTRLLLGALIGTVPAVFNVLSQLARAIVSKTGHTAWVPGWNRFMEETGRRVRPT
jgi:hypothetical protein